LTAAIKSSGNNDQYFMALGRIGAPSVDSLLDFVKSPNTCYPAADALAATKDPRIIEPLLVLFQTPYAGPPVPPGGVMGGMAGTGGGQATAPRPVCYQAIMHALSATDDPRVIGPIVQYIKIGPILRDGVPGELFHFGRLAIPALMPLLHDPDPLTRQIAAEALSRIDDPAVKTALLTALKERDLAVIRGAYQFYVSLGQPGSEDALAESLDRYPDQAMAEYFLNCGDVKLEDAARLWGTKQRWKITQQVYGVTWGKPLERPKIL
jgi:HEAT repeat protein